MNIKHLSIFIIFFILAVGLSADAKETKKEKAGRGKNKDKVVFKLVDSPASPSELLSQPLDQIPLQKIPIFTSDDFEDYSVESHSFLLREDAFRRLAAIHPSPKGTAFVVTVNRRPLYLGAFLQPQASVPFKGPVIVLPVGRQTPSVMRIELGYPHRSNFTGTDQRSDFRIIAIVKPLQTGKIKEPLHPKP